MFSTVLAFISLIIVNLSSFDKPLGELGVLAVKLVWMPYYPETLEDFWVKHTLQQLGTDSLESKQHVLEQRIQQLSDAFTKERNNLSKDYFKDPLTICAYGLFYFPQTYVRALFGYRDLVLRGWKVPENCSILDLGAGMGAASLALASQIPGAQITAIDRSPQSLSLLKVLDPTADVEVEDLFQWCSRNQKQFDLIVASFSLSETGVASEEWTNQLGKMLTKNGIALILEPSLKETSEWMEQWRDQISERDDLHIWAPCLHRKKCPLLQSGKYWCHEVRSWRPPLSLQFVNRHLYREVHITRFSFLAFGKSAPDALPGFSMRLISPISKQRIDYVLSSCGSDGNAHTFRISGKNLDSGMRNLIRKWERGDILMEDEKGIQILESGVVFVVQIKNTPHHEVRNE